MVVPKSQEDNADGDTVRDVLRPRLRNSPAHDDAVWEVYFRELIGREAKEGERQPQLVGKAVNVLLLLFDVRVVFVGNDR